MGGNRVIEHPMAPAERPVRKTMAILASKRSVVFGMILVLGFGPGGFAQQSHANQPAASETGNPDYVLGPGDSVSIHVGDIEEIPDKPVRIDPNGFIDLPLAGHFQASGLTLENFKTTLAGRLRKYITDPEISVALTDNQSRPVSVIGSVNTPGVHQLQGPKRLIEVISLAGGVKPDAGFKVVVTREAAWGKIPLPDAKMDPSGRFSTAVVSLDSLLNASDPTENIPVEPNDVISIPKAEVVYVTGQVRRSGGFPLSSHQSMSLLQAISLAEGLAPDAQSKKARILRPTEGDRSKVTDIPVDVRSILEGKAPDVQLFANDVLFVPNSAAKTATRRTIDTVLQGAVGLAIYAH